jgi:hypothetical protein
MSRLKLAPLCALALAIVINLVGATYLEPVNPEPLEKGRCLFPSQCTITSVGTCTARAAARHHPITMSTIHSCFILFLLLSSSSFL